MNRTTLGIAMIIIGSFLVMLSYAMLLNTQAAKKEIQACYDAGGTPIISNLNDFIACRGRRIK